MSSSPSDGQDRERANPRSKPRWYTCTPFPFGGGPDFFTRDSGLLCRGFQALGIESKAVMPLPGGERDEPDLIRVEAASLRSADWWRSQDLDGVVLYSWGSPRYLPVARAIHDAGIFLVLNQDNGGLVSPWIDPPAWVREQLQLEGAGRVRGGWARATLRILKGFILGPLYQDRMRASHLACGNVIACVSPEAAGHHRTFCRDHGGEALARRVTVLSHAVDSRFKPFPEIARERRIAAVGRWDDIVQKRPELLMATAERLLARVPDVVLHIVGRKTPALETWWQALPQDRQDRVRLEGRMEPDALARLWSQVQVGWCSSAFESFHIASGEALCCGASVVAGDSPSLASFRWFTAEGDGRLAGTDDAEGHADALEEELGAWSEGLRAPEEISKRWAARLHAPAVASEILKMQEMWSREGHRDA